MPDKNYRGNNYWHGHSLAARAIAPYAANHFRTQWNDFHTRAAADTTVWTLSRALNLPWGHNAQDLINRGNGKQQTYAPTTETRKKQQLKRKLKTALKKCGCSFAYQGRKIKIIPKRRRYRSRRYKRRRVR